MDGDRECVAQRRGRTRKQGLGRIDTKLSELLENMRCIDRQGPFGWDL